MAKNTIVVDFLGNTKKLNAATSRANRLVTGFGDKAKRVGKAVGLAFIGAGAGLATFGVKAVGSASDLNETLSKTEAILGDSSGAIIDWSKTTAKALGLSQRETLDFASGFSGALKNIGGLSESEAAKTAKSLTGLTADLGSFFNTSNEQTAAALNSALTGEFEPLKKFNVIVNDAILKQKALELGLYDGTGAMSAQAKQAATLELIYEQTADAQGDFARTGDSLANQQKKLGASFENLKARLGAQFLPVAQKTLGYLLDNLPAIERFASKAFAVIGEAVAVVVPLIQKLGTEAVLLGNAFVGFVTSAPVVGFMTGIYDAAKTLLGFLRDNQGPVLGALAALLLLWAGNAAIAAAAMIPLAAASIAAAAPAIALAAAFAAVGAGLVILYQKSDTFKAFVDRLIGLGEDLLGKVSELWPSIQSVISTVLDALLTGITVFTSTVSALWGVFGGSLTTIASGAWEVISSVFSGAFTIIGGLVNVFVALVTGDWGRMMDGMTSIASGAWEIITGVFSGAIGIITGLVSGFFTAILGIFGIGGDQMSSTMSATWSTITGIVSTAVGVVQSVISGFVSVINAILGVFGTDLTTLFQSTWNTVKSIVSSVTAIISGIIKTFIAIVTGDWQGAWANIQAVAQAGTNLVETIISAGLAVVKALFTGAFNAIKVGARAGMAALTGAVRSGMATAERAVSAGVRSVIAYIKGLPGRIKAALGNLGRLLFGAGKAILNGLTKGLKAGWQGAKKFVGGLGSKIKNLKGPIEVDRVLLTDEGNAIIEGLEKGLRKAWPNVQKRLQGFTQEIEGTRFAAPTVTPADITSTPQSQSARLQSVLEAQASPGRGESAQAQTVALLAEIRTLLAEELDRPRVEANITTEPGRDWNADVAVLSRIL